MSRMSLSELAPVPATAPEIYRAAGQKTIGDEIAALERLRDRLDHSFDAAVAALLTLGIGKSGIAAQKVAATLRSLGLPALYLNASDSMHGDLGVVGAGDVVMLVSKSGTTRELLALLPHLRGRGATLVAVHGSPGSPLARECDIALDASVEREGCPLDAAPMASVLCAQAIGDALAAAYTVARGFTTEDFARLHPAGALGARLTLTVGDVMRRGDELPRLETGGTLKDAVLEITRTGYGALCVTDGAGVLTGFLTDGDIRRQLLDVDNLSAVRIDDVMSRTPLTVTPDLPLSQALLVLEQRSKPLLAAPVVGENRECVGLLRLHDAVRAHLVG